MLEPTNVSDKCSKLSNGRDERCRLKVSLSVLICTLHMGRTSCLKSCTCIKQEWMSLQDLDVRLYARGHTP